PSGRLAQPGRRRRTPATSGTVSMSNTRIGVIGRVHRLSTSRQVAQRIDRLALPADLKMQFHAVRIAATELGDALTALDRLPLLHDDLAIVRIGTDELFAVFDDDEVAVTAKCAADIDDLA